MEVNAETRKVNAVAKPAAAKKAAAKVSAKTATQVVKVPEPKVVAHSAPAAPVAAGGGGLARSTRPSARLTQLTVPSMAPAAAFDAAKASYINTMPTTMQAPSLIAAKKDPQLANNWKTKSAEELTDAEVLAMPEDEYMNDKQMAFFRHKLVLLKQDMHNNAGETAENLREDTVVVPDPADRATIEEEHALELRTRDRERKLLKKIEQSITRIDAGDYGYCDETGEPIGVGRLLARPTATLSLEAQQRRELKQKMFGD
nr:RNA polymerase-binding protein DksA [Acidovorax sp. CCYZU-2555]